MKQSSSRTAALLPLILAIPVVLVASLIFMVGPVGAQRGVPVYPSDQRAHLDGHPSRVVIDDFKVNDDFNSSQSRPSIARTPSGEYVIAWLDNRNRDADIYAQLYDASGNPVGSNFKLNDAPSDIQWDDVTIAADVSGNFVAVWADNRNYGAYSSDIYARIFDSEGTPLGASFRVNDDVGDGWQLNPFIAMDVSGNFVIAWWDRRVDDNDIYAQRYDASGSPLGSNFRVNDDASNQNQQSPSVAMDGAANFIITWMDHRNGYQSDIYAQRYNFSGSPLGSNFKVDDGYASDVGFPDVAVDPSGSFVITWEDYRTGDPDIFAQRFDSFGSPVESNFRVNDDPGSTMQTSASVAMDGSGNFVIAWRDERNAQGEEYDAYAQRYNSSGEPQGTNFQVNDIAGSGPWNMYPDVATDFSGNFVIAWTDRRGGIYAQRYNSSGVAVGSNGQVNDNVEAGIQYTPRVVVDGLGGFLVAWRDSRGSEFDLYAQRYTSSGDPVGSNFIVNEETGVVDQYKLSAAMAPSGDFEVTWTDYRNLNRNVFAQMFNSSGTPVGSNFQVNDDAGATWQTDPSIAVNGSGDFVVVWKDQRNGNTDVFGQMYSSSGTPVGLNFQVNDDAGTAAQIDPSVAMDLTGNFVVVWRDSRSGSPDVYGQRYNSAGTPAGVNFQVNSVSGTSRKEPDVAMDNDGDFIVTWSDLRNGNWNIYAQRYGRSGSASGSNFKVNDDPGVAIQETPSVAMEGSGNFVIVWRDQRDGDHNVYAQRYSAGGSALGANFLVHDPVFAWADQSSPDVAATNSNIYFAWQDDHDGYFPEDWDIYGKVVDWQWEAGGEGPLGYTGYCPVDLIVTDPFGDSIGVDFNTISDAAYDTGQDYNGDGENDDRVIISNPWIGLYTVRVVGEPGRGSGYYSLSVQMGGNSETFLVDSIWAPDPGESDTVFYEAMKYLRGDPNKDGTKDIGDAVYILNYLFKGGPTPDPTILADVNCDGEIQIGDVIYMLNYLFKNGAPPCS